MEILIPGSPIRFFVLGHRMLQRVETKLLYCLNLHVFHDTRTPRTKREQLRFESGKAEWHAASLQCYQNIRRLHSNRHAVVEERDMEGERHSEDILEHTYSRKASALYTAWDGKAGCLESCMCWKQNQQVDGQDHIQGQVDCHFMREPRVTWQEAQKQATPGC